MTSVEMVTGNSWVKIFVSTWAGPLDRSGSIGAQSYTSTDILPGHCSIFLFSKSARSIGSIGKYLAASLVYDFHRWHCKNCSHLDIYI